MAKYKRKRKTSRKYRRKSPARSKKRKRAYSKRPKRRRRAARRIQRTYRRYARRKKKSTLKKKVAKVTKRLNVFLEPRVIRHGWTPTIGGGMGHTGANDIYNLPGINPATGAPGILNWMSDISTSATPADQALLQPMKRHNPLLYMLVQTANDVNNRPNLPVNPAPAYATCQPRRGQNNQQQAIPAGVSPGGFVGGAFAGGYDLFYHPFYRPASMLSTARLFQSTEDVIAYKQFPFIPRIEKNFDNTKFNGKITTDNVIPIMTSGTNVNPWQRLMKFECREGDRILVRNNYHRFDIECFPDLAIELPVTSIGDNMPGLPASYANGGELGNPLSISTVGQLQTGAPQAWIFNSGGTQNSIFPGTTGGTGPAGSTQMSAGTTPQVGKVETVWPGYIKKSPKWFCKIRFLVAKRQRQATNVALELIGTRQPQVTTVGGYMGSRDFLYDLKDYFQKSCLKTDMTAASIQTHGEYLNTPPPGQGAQGTPVVYAYSPSYLFDKRQHAYQVWKASKTKFDNQHKAKISQLLASTQPELTMSNPKDTTRRIIYDKTVMLSGKKRSMTHIMNTMKGKVIDYLKERYEDPHGTTATTQDAVDQEATQNPLNEEYRFWAIVHCHNCRMQMKAEHVFKFDE